MRVFKTTTFAKDSQLANSRTKKTVATSSILQAVHETAEDLHSSGLIDQTTMREFDALCLTEVPNYTPSQIKAIRTRCNVSQAVFARYLNVTTSSLQKWEIGSKTPSGVALKLLNLVDRKGIEILT